MIDPARFPAFPAEQIEFLQFIFPPRCKDVGESLEEHMKYAGKVELVQAIASQRAISGADMDDLEAEVAQAIVEARSK